MIIGIETTEQLKRPHVSLADQSDDFAKLKEPLPIGCQRAQEMPRYMF
jgi:hypothetical protein